MIHASAPNRTTQLNNNTNTNNNNNKTPVNQPPTPYQKRKNKKKPKAKTTCATNGKTASPAGTSASLGSSAATRWGRAALGPTGRSGLLTSMVFVTTVPRGCRTPCRTGMIRLGSGAGLWEGVVVVLVVVVSVVVVLVVLVVRGMQVMEGAEGWRGKANANNAKGGDEVLGAAVLLGMYVMGRKEEFSWECARGLCYWVDAKEKRMEWRQPFYIYRGKIIADCTYSYYVLRTPYYVPQEIY